MIDTEEEFRIWHQSLSDQDDLYAGDDEIDKIPQTADTFADIRSGHATRLDRHELFTSSL